MHDLAGEGSYAEVQARLRGLLITSMHGSDSALIQGDALVGLPDQRYEPEPDRGLSNQRGWR